MGIIIYEKNQRFFTLACRHAEPQFNLIRIAEQISGARTSLGITNVLFDFSELKSWPYKSPSLGDMKSWNEVAPSLTRAVFVHDYKWNRHVAILAALMRRGNALVRSCRPKDPDEALIWLNN